MSRAAALRRAAAANRPVSRPPRAKAFTAAMADSDSSAVEVSSLVRSRMCVLGPPAAAGISVP